MSEETLTTTDGTTVPLEQAAPAQVDAALAQIYGRYYRVLDRIELERRYAADYRGRLARGADGRYSYTDRDRARDEKGLAERTAALAALEQEASAILAEAEPLEAEHDRRGGWTRAFLVLNSNGHVHSSRGCPQCYPTTRFHWVVELSGATEADVVSRARAAACTTCYPSAPVELRSLPSLLEEPEKAAARAAREEKRAAAAKEKAAKAITSPDGSTLRTRYETIRTEVTAERTYVSTMADLAGWQPWMNQEVRLEREQDAQRILEALAHKRGTTAQAQRDLLAPKVERRIRANERQ